MCDLNGNLALRRQEDDIITVLNCKIQFIDAGIIQNGILVVVDKNIIGIGNLGFLVGAQTGLDALAVMEHSIDELRIPVTAG